MGMMPATNWFGMNGLFPLTEYAKSRPEHYFSRNYGGKYRMLPLGALHAYTGKDGTYNFNGPFLYPTERPELSIRPEYLTDKYRWDLEWAERMGVDGFGALLFRYYLSDDNGIAMDLLPGHAGIYRFWSPVAGRIRFTCRLVGDSATEVDFLIKEGASELYAATCAAGDTLTARLERDVKYRARIDFIVRAAAQSRASVVLHPRIQLINTPKSLLPQGED